jgi:hypothetical protein
MTEEGPGFPFPRLRAVTHFGVQARALARGAPPFLFGFVMLK